MSFSCIWQVPISMECQGDIYSGLSDISNYLEISEIELEISKILE